MLELFQWTACLLARARYKFAQVSARRKCASAATAIIPPSDRHQNSLLPFLPFQALVISLCPPYCPLSESPVSPGEAAIPSRWENVYKEQLKALNDGASVAQTSDLVAELGAPCVCRSQDP